MTFRPLPQSIAEWRPVLGDGVQVMKDAVEAQVVTPVAATESVKPQPQAPIPGGNRIFISYRREGEAGFT